jgi:hypothetical protein
LQAVANNRLLVAPRPRISHNHPWLRLSTTPPKMQQSPGLSIALSRATYV